MLLRCELIMDVYNQNVSADCTNVYIGFRSGTFSVHDRQNAGVHLLGIAHVSDRQRRGPVGAAACQRIDII
jgi:hypothetical protein